MQAAFYLLCGFACLGGIDIGYYHLYRFTLFRVPSSVAEHLTTIAWRILPLPLWARALGLQVLIVTAGLCLFESVQFIRVLSHRHDAASAARAT